MVNYQFNANDPRLKQVRQQAKILRDMAYQSGKYGKGVSQGNVKGFDLDAYRRAVEGGASGSLLKAQALENAGQHQIYRSQPEVAKYIEDLSNKVDVSNSHISHARANTSTIKTAQDIRNAVVDNSTDPQAILPEVNPISPEGFINMKTSNIAPIAHPLYENQAVDDMVSNSQSMTATPDEQVTQGRFAPPQNYGIPPEQQIYDDMINANNQVEPDDSSGTGYIYDQNNGNDLGDLDTDNVN